jgi:hypothetical protein
MGFCGRIVWSCFVVALALAGGCSHQPKRVDCDGRLEPINPPTPVVHSEKSSGTGSEP